VVILGIHQPGERELLEIGRAGDTARLLARLREDGEEDGSKDSDDGYHNQEFDQGERPHPLSSWHGTGPPFPEEDQPCWPAPRIDGGRTVPRRGDLTTHSPQVVPRLQYSLPTSQGCLHGRSLFSNEWAARGKEKPAGSGGSRRAGVLRCRRRYLRTR